MKNLSIKFEMTNFSCYENMNGDAKCGKWIKNLIHGLPLAIKRSRVRLRFTVA